MCLSEYLPSPLVLPFALGIRRQSYHHCWRALWFTEHDTYNALPPYRHTSEISISYDLICFLLELCKGDDPLLQTTKLRCREDKWQSQSHIAMLAQGSHSEFTLQPSTAPRYLPLPLWLLPRPAFLGPRLLGPPPLVNSPPTHSPMLDL